MIVEDDELYRTEAAPQWLRRTRRLLLDIPARTLREYDMLSLAHRALCAIEADDIPVPRLDFPVGEPLTLAWRNERMRMGLTVCVLDERNLTWIRHMPNGMDRLGQQTTSILMVRDWVTWLFPQINGSEERDLIE